VDTPRQKNIIVPLIIATYTPVLWTFNVIPRVPPSIDHHSRRDHPLSKAGVMLQAISSGAECGNLSRQKAISVDSSQRVHCRTHSVLTTTGDLTAYRTLPMLHLQKQSFAESWPGQHTCCAAMT